MNVCDPKSMKPVKILSNGSSICEQYYERLVSNKTKKSETKIPCKLKGDNCAIRAVLGPTVVICGRHGLAWNNKGNEIFRRVMVENVQRYLDVKSIQAKTNTIVSVKKYLEVDLQMRFLKQSRHGKIRELDNRQIHMKIGHALRDVAKARGLVPSKSSAESEDHGCKDSLKQEHQGPLHRSVSPTPSSTVASMAVPPSPPQRVVSSDVSACLAPTVVSSNASVCSPVAVVSSDASACPAATVVSRDEASVKDSKSDESVGSTIFDYLRNHTTIIEIEDSDEDSSESDDEPIALSNIEDEDCFQICF